MGKNEVAKGLFDAIVFPKDLVNYSVATMLDLTNCHEELLDKVITLLSILFHTIISSLVFLNKDIMFFIVYPCSSNSQRET